MKKLIIISLAALAVYSCGSSKKIATLPLTDKDYEAMSTSSSDSSVKMTENESAQYNNMIDYIRDRVPGIQTEGDGSSSNKLIVRGITSLKGSNDPLIIVDGVEVNDINIVDPQDVYSVDVIKDGSASVYGVKGSAGVIVVNTKHARYEAEQARLQKKAEKEAKRNK